MMSRMLSGFLRTRERLAIVMSHHLRLNKEHPELHITCALQSHIFSYSPCFNTTSFVMIISLCSNFAHMSDEPTVSPITTSLSG